MDLQSFAYNSLQLAAGDAMFVPAVGFALMVSIVAVEPIGHRWGIESWQKLVLAVC